MWKTSKRQYVSVVLREPDVTLASCTFLTNPLLLTPPSHLKVAECEVVLARHADPLVRAQVTQRITQARAQVWVLIVCAGVLIGG